MGKTSTLPMAIEGQEIEVQGQDIKPGGIPRNYCGSVSPVFPISVKKKGRATVIISFSGNKGRCRDYSHLKQGDQINGKILWGVSSFPLKRESIVVGSSQERTGSHSNQRLILKGQICFLEIVQTWSGNSLSIHPQNSLLQ